MRGEYVYAVKHLAGQPVVDLLPGLLLDIFESLSFPKNLRWADCSFRFVRPIRWLVALFGEKVIPVEITGVKSGRYSMGHRFMQQSMKEAVETKGLLSAAINKVGNVVHSAVMGMQGAVEIPNADAYVQALADNFVMVDQDARRELIRQQVTELAAVEGGIAEIDEETYWKKSIILLNILHYVGNLKKNSCRYRRKPLSPQCVNISVIFR